MPVKKASPKSKKESTDEVDLTFRFKFSDDARRVFTIALTDLTTREQVEIEEFFDRPLEIAINSGWLLNSRKGLVLLAYLARRRRDPEFTYDDALDAYDKMADEEDESPPTKASKATGSPT